MPIYEYECCECNKIFDILQNVNDNSLPDCVYCGGKTKKVYNPAGIIFKGSGFYKTDYRKPDKRKETGKSEKPSGKKAKPPDEKSK